MNNIIYILGILTLVSLVIPFLLTTLLVVLSYILPFILKIVNKILNKKGNSSITKQWITMATRRYKYWTSEEIELLKSNINQKLLGDQ